MTEPGIPSDMSVPDVSVPDPDMIESRIAKDIARHALWVAPVAILALGLWKGVGGALGVALALVVVLANFLITGALLGWAARISPAMIMAVSLGCGLATLRALYVVTPAHVKGAASKELTPAGTRTTWEAWPTAYSAYEPSIV